jgi:chromosome segregation ATPase
MSKLNTKSTSKKLRSSVAGLVRDAEQHLPKEFRPRLRTVSKLFFEHRREGSQLVEKLDAAQCRVQRLESELKDNERDQAELQKEIERLHRQIDYVKAKCSERDVTLEQLERDHASEFAKQKQDELSARHAVDDLLLRLGDVAQGKYACTVKSVTTSNRVQERLSKGELKNSQIEQAVRRAVGFYVSQSEPDDTLYEWYPTGLRALVRVSGQPPTALDIDLDSIELRETYRGRNANIQWTDAKHLFLSELEKFDSSF